MNEIDNTMLFDPGLLVDLTLLSTVVFGVPGERISTTSSATPKSPQSKGACPGTMRNTQTSPHEVVHVDGEIYRAAIDNWLRGYADQEFSLTDAVSFETMRQRGIERAITLDRHFRTAGFDTIP